MSQSKINDIKAKIIIALDLAQDDKAAEVLACIIEENHSIEDFIYEHQQGEDTDSRDQLQDFIDSFDESDSDQTLEFDGNEYRIISAGSIWEIYRDEIENIVTDCYDLKLDKIPDFISVSIVWEKTAQNAFAD
jgi:hypothetical protein